MRPVVASNTGRAVCSVMVEGPTVGANSARRANRFEVANCARVRVAMGALTTLRCLLPSCTIVQPSLLVMFEGGMGRGMGSGGTPGGGIIGVGDGVGTSAGTPGGGGVQGCWVYVLRMDRSVSMAVNCSSAGAGVIRPMVVLIVCKAWIILSSAVMCGVGRLWGRNLTALLMITARDSLVRTQ